MTEEKMKTTDKETSSFVNNPVPTIQEEIIALKLENAELKEKNSILKNDVRVAREDRERLQIKVGKGLQEFIHDCPYTALKYYASSRLVEENAELKEKLNLQNQRLNELKKDKEYLDNVNNEQTEVILKLNAQIEKMKCCGNCKHNVYDCGERYCEYDWNREKDCRNKNQ